MPNKCLLINISLKQLKSLNSHVIFFYYIFTAAMIASADFVNWVLFFNRADFKRDLGIPYTIDVFSS